ncbi:efflux RND transporter periplasmic adaptor subunit [Pseudothauera nasutitermitis]|uniref:Efflux RND transporter periplasmic adaptor subunit n=1 Tax=Pseudothauera nasutitermitis TaxID=2565930 RepID=A0A4V3WCI9_9RHOO|nr:efflux RND transporter periplasmic adaptor subunit [Pseudothauera nasutitermitis]THF67304.1 efflux RND transporter periplasmic adaptor subunit [Pseudothauera nasutitermitis]
MNDKTRNDASDFSLDDAPARSWWRRPRTWIAAALILLALLGLRFWLGAGTAGAPQYVTEEVTRGTLRLSINATGTLQPTRSVEIGSELSGTVARVLVDVNDRVKIGQVLVELDTAKLHDDVERARASLASAEASVAEAVATVQENRSTLARLEEVARLSGGKVPSRTELDTARAALARAEAAETSARAAVVEAKATLATNETNLGKASIRSPIDGVVLARDVDPGNAVAASLQAVTLFTLAEDLSRLKLEVNVDEADIGQVATGQPANFTVSAWPNRRYPATVTRVDFGSTTTDNVVTYTTTLDVANEDLSLRPGMTASAIITATERENVILVPNMALRFTPVLPAASGGGGGRGLVGSLLPRPPEQTVVPRSGGADARQVWVLRNGQAVAVPVSTGLSDGRTTEIVSGELQPGERAIVDQRSGAAR